MRTIIRFGIFAAMTLALTGWIFGSIVNFTTTPRYQLGADFSDVEGLSVGDPVQLAGVNVGKVSTIKAVNGHAHVTFSIDKKVPLPTDSEVDVRWRNLIGQRYLLVSPGTARTMLASGGTVRNARSVVDIGDLVNDLGPLASAVKPSDLNTVVKTLSQVLDGNTTNVQQLVIEFGNFLKVLGARQGTISQLITDANTISTTLAQRDTEIQSIIDNLASLSQAFASNTNLVSQALDQFAPFSTGLKQLLSDNGTTLASLIDNLAGVTNTAAARISYLEGTLNKMPYAFHQLFSATDRGQMLTVLLTCISPTPTCPYPMVEAESMENNDDRRLQNDQYYNANTGGPPQASTTSAPRSAPAGSGGSGSPGVQAVAALIAGELK